MGTRARRRIHCREDSPNPALRLPNLLSGYFGACSLIPHWGSGRNYVIFGRRDSQKIFHKIIPSPAQ